MNAIKVYKWPFDKAFVEEINFAKEERRKRSELAGAIEQNSLLIFFPGLWANVADYQDFLNFVASKLNISEIRAFEFSDMIGKVNNLESKYNYSYLFEYLSSLIFNDLNPFSKVYIMGHSLGGAITLGLYCGLISAGFDSPAQESLDFWALSPAGLPGDFWTNINYWLILPLKHFITRSPVGSVPKNVLREVKMYKNPFLPFKHFARVVSSNFLSDFCKNKKYKKRKERITLHIVNAVREDVIPRGVVEQIDAMFKNLADFQEIGGAHNWPLVKGVYENIRILETNEQ